MKKAFLFTLTLLLFLQIGCTHAVRYTEEEIKNFQPAVQDNIRKGQIDLGMTPEQVRYAWGSPISRKSLEPFEDKSREEWIYSSSGIQDVVGTKILLFFDGKLIYIK
jgi:outer membrane protein assembly factor BamE (lipoprotein component of BamABCDE complex)